MRIIFDSPAYYVSKVSEDLNLSLARYVSFLLTSIKWLWSNNSNTFHSSTTVLCINTATSVPIKHKPSLGCRVHRWVKNYPHFRYMFCSWLCCWLRMTKYTWSTALLPLWCRCDIDSTFLSWVLCHKHGHSQFHLHQRRAEGSDPFLWAEGVPGVETHRMMSVQYWNSVMSQWIVC